MDCFKMTRLIILLSLAALACGTPVLIAPADSTKIDTKPMTAITPHVADELRQAVACVPYMVNVRTDAGTEHGVIDQLADQTPVIITGEKLDRFGYVWDAVSYGDKSGYVYSKYICE